MTMPDRRVSVAITFPDERMPQRCAGPAPDSGCPLANEAGVVACAGATIVPLRGTVADGRPHTVTRRVGPRCPLADLVRHTAAPWD